MFSCLYSPGTPDSCFGREEQEGDRVEKCTDFLPSNHIYRQPVQSMLPSSLELLMRHIERDKDLISLFQTAFDEIPPGREYVWTSQGCRRVHDYRSMVQSMASVLQTAPIWTNGIRNIQGCPMNDVLLGIMNTTTGSLIFQRSDINQHLYRILNAWTQHLCSARSRDVLDTSPTGWLSEDAQTSLLRVVNLAYNSTSHAISRFDAAYVSDADQPHYGFESWDDFFTRRFRPEVRPVASLEDENVIVNACESCPMFLQSNIAARSSFWLKEQPYSLIDMLDGDPLARHFIGGSIYQAFLSALSYHRWHAPVAGTVVRILKIPGSYFAALPSKGYDNVNPHTGKPAPDKEAPQQSQRFIASVATRLAVFIQADNPRIGLMAVLFIGMAEVSSCEPSVVVGQRVRKGQEIGRFRYGGSTHCMIFQPNVKLEFVEEVRWTLDRDERVAGRNLAVNSQLATVL